MENSRAEALLDAADARRLTEKKDELERLANSTDGRRVRDKLDGAGIAKAFEQGDMQTVTGAISGILETPEGARLAQALRELMK
jgi:hypothetical protein